MSSSCPDPEEDLVRLWRGADRVAVRFLDRLDGPVGKLVSCGDRVFLMTVGPSCGLYYGQVVVNNNEGRTEDEEEVQAYSLELRRSSELGAVDLAANGEHAFVVTSEGCVLKVDPEDLRVLETIVLREEVKYCSHGYGIL